MSELPLQSGPAYKAPPHGNLSILQHLVSSYKLWFEYYQKLPKTHRYSLGLRIDTLFIESIEATNAAAFLAQQDKIPFVRLAVRKVDTIKTLLLILWEVKSLETKRYAALSEKINEVGRMLGGWNNQLAKTNSPANAGEK